MGFISILGLVSGIIGFWDFGDNMFPAQKDMFSSFKVYVGIDGSGGPEGCCLEDAGGTIRAGFLYDSGGHDIGHGGMFPQLKSGSDEEITMWQNVPQPAVMAKFLAGKDAVCIAAIGATLHDGTKWGWVGDWGKICGLDWYYSGVTQPNWNNSSPLCTWIDEDHSNHIRAGVIAINWAGFTTVVLPFDGGLERCDRDFLAWDRNDGDSVISSTRKGSRDQGAAARGRAARPNNGNNGDRRLVVSSLPDHSAEELCRHPSSRGPSFVSLAEGAHCDMGTREVLPLCAGGLMEGCFDLEAEVAADRAMSSAGAGGGVGSANASRIIYW